MNASYQSPEMRRSAENVGEDLARAGDRAREFADEAREGAGEEFRRLMADMEDLIKKVAHVSDADIAKVRDRAQRTLTATRKSVQDGAARVQARGRDLAHATDGYVQERPWTALGVAAAVGVILGLLAARR